MDTEEIETKEPIRERLRKAIVGKEGVTFSIEQVAKHFGCPASSMYVPIKELQSEGLLKFNKGRKSFTVAGLKPKGAEVLIETAQEACMLIIGAYEGYQWEHGRSCLEATASKMFEYAKAGYAAATPGKSIIYFIDNFQSDKRLRYGIACSLQADLASLGIDFPDNERQQFQDKFAEGLIDEVLDDMLSKVTQKQPTPTPVKEDNQPLKESLYTHYKIDLKNMTEEWDETIVDSLERLFDTIRYLDIHLDDDTETSDGEPRSITITGVGMTRAAYLEYLKNCRENE